jgi:hypothetical protein|nr:MAG TPA: CPKC Virion protein N terminal domain [Caudoviricetes sp.]
MGEKNKDLDNLYLQCQSCANKYTSFECALCEDFDMYKEENINTGKEGIATLHRAEYVVPDSELELIQDTAKDLGQFFVELGRQIRLDMEKNIVSEIKREN